MSLDAMYDAGNQASKPGDAWIWNDSTQKWVQPEKPTDGATYVWDDNLGWKQDTSSLSGLNTAIGFVLTDVMTNDPKYGKEIANILNLFRSGNRTAAINAYYDSNFYKDMGVTVADRRLLKAQQPGAYKEALNDFISRQTARLVRLGVKASDASLTEWLTEAFDNNLNDYQINTMIAKSVGVGSTFGGETLADTEELKQFADAYGISYDANKYNAWASQLFAGTTTMADLKLAIQTEAASAFPAYADQIMKGTTMDAISSSYKASMAQFLEIDPDMIGYTDPKLRAALQYVDPTTGKPSALPLWQWEKQVKADPRWQYTNNARDTVDGMQYKVLKDWGLI